MMLQDFISKYDTLDSKGFDEYQIAIYIWDKDSKGDSYYEGLAFEFGEYPDGTGWGIFYGYQTSFTLTDGDIYSNINETDITEDAVHYWQKRITTSVNPLFKARFSGLVLDFGKKFGIRPDVNLINTFINALILVIEGSYCSDFGITKKVDILIKVTSGYTKDVSLRTKAAETILNYLTSYSKVQNIGIWGRVYSSIICSKLFTETQKDKATKIAENNFEEIKNKLNNPWLLEDAATMLSDSYGKGDNRILPLLKDVEVAFKKVSEGVSGFQAQGWLQLVERLYRKYGYKDEADRILAEIASLGPKALKGMQVHSQTYKVPKKELDTFVEALHDKSLPGSALDNLALFLVPNEEIAVNYVKEAAKKEPLYYTASQQLIDDKGRPLSVVGAISNNEEKSDIAGHVVLAISRNLQFQAVLLRYALSVLNKEGTFNIFTVEKEYKSCPIFDRKRYETIDYAITQYFIGNHLVFAHLMTPQIENALRDMLEMTGVSSLKPQQGGKGNTLKTLDAVLREPVLEQVMGHDSVNYLRILLTDQRGWNLRNRICHGMMPIEGFNYTTSDRIMHAFLLLCQVRQKE